MMLEKIKQLCIKYRSIIMYVIIGAITTLINWVAFWLCFYVVYVPNVPSNIIAWIVAVAFAFASNKVWVFESRSWESKVWMPELLKFVGGRIGTGLIDLALMWLTVDVLGLHAFLMKILVSIIVLILNYVISKLLVFKKER